MSPAVGGHAGVCRARFDHGRLAMIATFAARAVVSAAVVGALLLATGRGAAPAAPATPASAQTPQRCRSRL